MIADASDVDDVALDKLEHIGDVGDVGNETGVGEIGGLRSHRRSRQTNAAKARAVVECHRTEVAQVALGEPAAVGLSPSFSRRAGLVDDRLSIHDVDSIVFGRKGLQATAQILKGHGINATKLHTIELLTCARYRHHRNIQMQKMLQDGPLRSFTMRTKWDETQQVSRAKLDAMPNIFDSGEPQIVKSVPVTVCSALRSSLDANAAANATRLRTLDSLAFFENVCFEVQYKSQYESYSMIHTA